MILKQFFLQEGKFDCKWHWHASCKDVYNHLLQLPVMLHWFTLCGILYFSSACVTTFVCRLCCLSAKCAFGPYFKNGGRVRAFCKKIKVPFWPLVPLFRPLCSLCWNLDYESTAVSKQSISTLTFIKTYLSLIKRLKRNSLDVDSFCIVHFLCTNRGLWNTRG